MRIALIASPFIAVPPSEYGGTELFIADLATALSAAGHDVIVYANGESKVSIEVRSLFANSQWPIKNDAYAQLKDMEHTAWALHDAAQTCDLAHVNSAIALSCSRISTLPFIYTVHHTWDRYLSGFYARHPAANYVCISKNQSRRLHLPKMRVIHHGIDISKYRLQTEKQPYLSFIGRIAPIKGTHLAIDIARKADIPLKIAGEVQPVYKEYFETKVKPHIDGKFIEYVGRANLAAKNELLGHSQAMLFPIKWDEPFGLVMVEAMACGTPVLALRGGSVPEVVRDGVSGFVGRNTEVAAIARNRSFSATDVRKYVEENFSKERMATDYAQLYSSVLE